MSSELPDDGIQQHFIVHGLREETRRAGLLGLGAPGQAAKAGKEDELRPAILKNLAELAFMQRAAAPTR